MPRSGFVALVGLPNAGKSTLMNRLIGESLSIISPKPQTTRDRVVGVLTRDDVQMVFVDTPGLMEPEYELHHRMRAQAVRALRDADVVLYVADATQGAPPPINEIARADIGVVHPVLALNKSDLLTAPQRDALAVLYPEGVFISAVEGEGIDTVLEQVSARLPEGPALYPADELSSQPMRFFAAEFVREAALDQLEEEVPYSIACIIEEFREDRSPMYIRATLHVERDSQKRILIGAKGARIRALGTAARARIEALVGGPVYLDLWVKVAPHWRRDPRMLDQLGYRLPE